MNNLAKHFVSVIVVALGPFFSNLTLASPLASTLEKTMSERGDWLNDPNEASYFANRCAALNSAISGYFNFHAGSNIDLQNAKLADADRDMYILHALFLGELAGLSHERVGQQFLLLGKLYREAMEHNKLTLNNGLHTPVIDDLRFCNRFKPRFQELLKMIQPADVGAKEK